MIWRYEFISTKTSSQLPIVIDGGGFKAIDTDDAKVVLAAVMKNIKSTGPTRPDAIRLIERDGNEIWRALLSTRK